jgi:hypothetical protein
VLAFIVDKTCLHLTLGACEPGCVAQGSLRCLTYANKRVLGASQLGKHTLVFYTLFATPLIPCLLGEIFLDIGVYHSLSTITSTLSGAFFVGAPVGKLP